jgi:putative FmdB family regulatory protein
MPVYEYRCAACAATYEKLVRHADRADAVPCPTCGGEGTRLLSLVAARGRGADDASPTPAAMPSGGGCCGGGACGA